MTLLNLLGLKKNADGRQPNENKGNLMSILIKKTFKKPDGIPFPKPSGLGEESDRHSQWGESGDVWLLVLSYVLNPQRNLIMQDKLQLTAFGWG